MVCIVGIFLLTIQTVSIDLITNKKKFLINRIKNKIHELFIIC